MEKIWSTFSTTFMIWIGVIYEFWTMILYGIVRGRFRGQLPACDPGTQAVVWWWINLTLVLCCARVLLLFLWWTDGGVSRWWYRREGPWISLNTIRGTWWRRRCHQGWGRGHSWALWKRKMNTGFFFFLNSSIRHKTTLPSTTFEHATKLYFQYPIL